LGDTDKNPEKSSIFDKWPWLLLLLLIIGGTWYIFGKKKKSSNEVDIK
jgi:cbb3-type cytochrome oxidase subunit 3